jgi:hypothetical protein
MSSCLFPEAASGDAPFDRATDPGAMPGRTLHGSVTLPRSSSFFKAWRAFLSRPVNPFASMARSMMAGILSRNVSSANEPLSAVEKQGLVDPFFIV